MLAFELCGDAEAATVGLAGVSFWAQNQGLPIWPLEALIHGGCGVLVGPSVDKR
jgi:hypothetical protein